MQLPRTMRALVAYAPGDYRLVKDYPVPRANRGELIVKIEGCGVSAGDCKAFHGAPSYWGGDGSPSYFQTPRIPGHEFIGTVVEVGEGMEAYRIGEQLIAELIIPCGECRYCKSDRYWMCQKHNVYGFQMNGGMAEYMRFAPGSIIYRLPEALPLEKALLIGPYACSWHSVERAQIRKDDFVVLAGCGTLGLGIIGAIKKLTGARLAVVDLNDARLKKALSFGADLVMNPAKENVTRRVLDLTEGYGCDVYIEATGHPSAVRQGLEMIRKLGRFVEVSVFMDLVTADWSILSDRKELDVLGVHLGPYCHEPVMGAIADGSLPTDGVLSHRFPLEDWEAAFHYAATGKDNAFKVALIPG